MRRDPKMIVSLNEDISKFVPSFNASRPVFPYFNFNLRYRINSEYAIAITKSIIDIIISVLVGGAGVYILNAHNLAFTDGVD
jgi:hypothetical protein